QIQGQLLPVLAPILGPVHGRRARAGEDGLRVGRVYGQGPDVQVGLRPTDPLPASAVVPAAIHAAIGPSKERVSLRGVQRERPYPTLQGERLAHPLPGLTPIRALPQALPDRADADGIVLCHHTLLLPCVYIEFSQGTMIVC